MDPRSGATPDKDSSVGSASANPFVFVVGCPRSGTTLLQRMLNNHPMLAVANDTHFIPRCLEKLLPAAVRDVTLGRDQLLTSALADGVRAYHRFPRLGLEDQEAREAEDGCSTYGEYVSALYTRFAKKHGKAYGGEKTPDYVRRLPLLHGLFPNARVLHIIRDGRDTALSILQWANEKKGPGRFDLWETQPVAVTALWWRWQVGTGRRDGARLGPDRYREVGYEELVAHPAEQLTEICGFLGLPSSDQMLRYHEGRQKQAPGLSAKSAWLPPTSGLRDWRTQMRSRDVELFEALAGDMLQELGQERATSETSPEVARLAEDCRNWWDETLARKEAKARRRAGEVG